MTNMEDMRAFRKWILSELKRLEADESNPEMGSPKETRLIETWRENRPQMGKNLERMRILPQTAYVLTCLEDEATTRYLKAGMSYPDAAEQAQAEFLMLSPETDENEEEKISPLAQLATMLDESRRMVRESRSM